VLLSLLGGYYVSMFLALSSALLKNINSETKRRGKEKRGGMKVHFLERGGM
jgi:hypothetical protein